MSLIETLRNKPPKTRHWIIVGISSFLLLVIILIGAIWYKPPYKRVDRPEYKLSNPRYFKNIFSNAGKNADEFVDPIDEYFTQQNEDNSSGIHE